MTPQPAAKAIPNFREETAQVNGIRLHYWIGGNLTGPPVLLWHGFLGTGFSWHKVMPLLAEEGYAVLVPDMRGYGDSDKPAGNIGYDGRALVSDFRALTHQIGFGARRPLTIAAHDMGAPPVLLWAADHPEEIAGLAYIEAPVMLQSALEKVIVYTPEAMQGGSMWWWILPLAPGVPERLIVGHERNFLEWFFRGKAIAKPDAISAATVDEYLRTFSGAEGVLGALGVYRTAFETIRQTEPLTSNKVQVPIIAMGGEKGLAEKVGMLVSMVGAKVTKVVQSGYGHFLPEECPEAVVQQIEILVRDRI